MPSNFSKPFPTNRCAVNKVSAINVRMHRLLFVSDAESSVPASVSAASIDSASAAAAVGCWWWIIDERQCMKRHRYWRENCCGRRWIDNKSKYFRIIIVLPARWTESATVARELYIGLLPVGNVPYTVYRVYPDKWSNAPSANLPLSSLFSIISFFIFIIIIIIIMVKFSKHVYK